MLDSGEQPLIVMAGPNYLYGKQQLPLISHLKCDTRNCGRNGVAEYKTKLLNKLSNSNLLPGKIGEMTKNEETNFVHKFKNNFILGNNDLVHSIFLINLSSTIYIFFEHFG